MSTRAASPAAHQSLWTTPTAASFSCCSSAAQRGTDGPCHAYTLLSTHYHLVLEATRANLSAGIHQLKGRYADHVNRRHSSFGHVFAERFQARVIESEEPSTKRVRMLLRIRSPPASATRPEDWPWSYCRDAA